MVYRTLDQGHRGVEAWPGELGAALIVAATLVDWIGAPAAVTWDNERTRRALVPTVTPGGAGLAFAGTF